MSTRFYLPSSGSADVSPAFASAWDFTAQATRCNLPKKTVASVTTLTDSAISTAISTNKATLCRQFVSSPLAGQTISGTWTAIVRCAQDLPLTSTSKLALILRACSIDGSTIRGTLYSNLTLDSAIATLNLGGLAETRRVNAGALSSLTIQPGDRLVLEVGVTVVLGLALLGNVIRFGCSAGADFPGNSGDTDDDNPWVDMPDVWEPPSYLPLLASG